MSENMLVPLRYKLNQALKDAAVESVEEKGRARNETERSSAVTTPKSVAHAIAR